MQDGNPQSATRHPQPIPVALIGAGHMGRHHARIYSELPGVELLGIVDADSARARARADQYRTAAYGSVEPLLGRIRAATVAVPTVAHVAVALPLIERGIAVLIEKPLAPDSTGCRVLMEAARRHGALLQVGHSERFNPVVRAMSRMQVAPRFIETHRISPFTFRSADISVVMDMMIHDIDIVLHLVRSRPVKVDAAGVSVLARHADICNARVAFENGCVANLTASRLALKTERKIRVFSPEAYLSIDYARKVGIAIKKDANLDLLKLARERQAADLSQLAGVDFGSLVKVEPLQVDDVEPLRAELQSFVHALQTGSDPEVSAADGAAAVDLAERITAAMQEHDWQLPAC
ncbi:MAG: oxidoreductase [Phycisphaerae bacterium]